MKNHKNKIIKSVLFISLFISLLIFSCTKTDTETLVIFNSLNATSAFNSSTNTLTLTLNETENIRGLQYEVKNNNSENLTIESFNISPTYNLYNNTCYTNNVSNNMAVCVVSTSNITNPITTTGIINISMILENSATAKIQNLIVTNKNLETFSVTNIDQ